MHTAHQPSRPRVMHFSRMRPSSFRGSSPVNATCRRFRSLPQGVASVRRSLPLPVRGVPLTSHQHLTSTPSLGHSVSPRRLTWSLGTKQCRTTMHSSQPGRQCNVNMQSAVRSCTLLLGAGRWMQWAQIWIAGETSRCISVFVTSSTRIPPLVTLTNP